MLKIQSGEIIEYFHDVYESFYEKDIFLKFENEILIEENTINNTLKEWRYTMFTFTTND